MHESSHDHLTGLPSRTRFVEQLELALAGWRQRPQDRFAILFMDVDGIREVNETRGRFVGDALLQEIAEATGSCVRAGDLLARVAGDEFAILMRGPTSDGEAVTVAELVQRALSGGFRIRGEVVPVSVSIGIAFPERRDHSALDLLRNAATAMYRAKSAGRGRHAMFASAPSRKSLDMGQLEAELRMAVERDTIGQHYQPIFELPGRRVIGFEALARWQHQDRGLLDPREFIPLAEETGLIAGLDAAALRRACAFAASLPIPADGAAPFVAANISNRLLGESLLVESVTSALEATGLDPERLVLEIREGTVMDDGAAANLRHLRVLGVRVCIDDFGAGHASLSYLHKLPVDAIKIDRSFTRQLLNGSDHMNALQAIADLAARLGITVIAEGVETQAQLQQMEWLGLTAVQGFLFSPPVAAGIAATLLAAGDGQVPVAASTT
ncbi:MAG TPA: bifunctional diguanylate cyclase/phosphodiesterase [Longimicrobiales bacterium]|nr:bifunctional diguanylate cyclase/phosphodiesterase [Longimicrobiales bacterium]